MSLNEKLIKEYEEMGEVEFYKAIRKRAYKIRKSRGSDYTHITIIEGNELSVLQFKGKVFKFMSGNDKVYYFNR